jgi:hypothetical protein
MYGDSLSHFDKLEVGSEWSHNWVQFLFIQKYLDFFNFDYKNLILDVWLWGQVRNLILDICN